MIGVNVLERSEVERVARQGYGKLVAILARRSRDVQTAEDAVSDALTKALEVWPIEGIPGNPEAWLVRVAQNSMTDAARRERRRVAWNDEAFAGFAENQPETSPIPDERLGLLFACAHPAIDESIRAPLMLQVVLGVEASLIARAYLVSPEAMAQRLVRAKIKIRDAGIPMEVPEALVWRARVDDVLMAVYAAFNAGLDSPTPDGQSDHPGGDLAAGAIELARVLIALVSHEPEIEGLLALMLYSTSRRAARDQRDHFVPLHEQDPSQWDADLIDQAEALLRRAAERRLPGRFQIEAMIQSAHVDGVRTGTTNWHAIASMYHMLLAVAPSIGAQVALAAALGQAGEAQEGLALIDRLEAREIASYQPAWAVRGHLHMLVGDVTNARAALQRAAGLTTDPRVRAYLLHKADQRG